MTWLESLLYGLLSGLAEFLPISADAHRHLFCLLTGKQDHPLMELAVHVACFLALLLCCLPLISRLQREWRIATIPPKRRKRQPDLRRMKDLRFVKTAIVPVLLGFAAWPFVKNATDNLWLMALLLAVNGIILYLPPYFPAGNKESHSISGLDAVLTGLAGAVGAVPGFSRIGLLTTMGQLRGCDRRYILDIGLLLCIPANSVMIILDIASLLTYGANFPAGLLLGCLLAGAMAFPAAYFAITFIRFLSVKVGFSGFAYYSWGAAMFTFILYLTV